MRRLSGREEIVIDVEFLIEMDAVNGSYRQANDRLFPFKTYEHLEVRVNVLLLDDRDRVASKLCFGMINTK